jgi:hypothetical protein
MLGTSIRNGIRSTFCCLLVVLFLSAHEGCATARKPSLCNGHPLRGEEVLIYRAGLATRATGSTTLWHMSEPLTRPIQIPVSRRLGPHPSAPWESLDVAASERASTLACLVALAPALGLPPTTERKNGTLSLTGIGVADDWAYFQYSIWRDFSVQTTGVLERDEKGTWTVVLEDTIEFADLKR